MNPFIDPVTKSKIKPNEPLPNHVPASQLMKVSGGEVDFKYDHSVYWPALEKLTNERRQQRKERWEKAGKKIGEYEDYLKGGNAKCLSQVLEEAGGVPNADKAETDPDLVAAEVGKLTV